MLLFSVAPFARLSWTALAPAVSLDPLARLRLLGEPVTLRALWNTLEVALLSGALALALGLSLALVLAVTDVRAKRTIAFVMVLGLMIAPQVAALAFKTLAGPASPLLGAIGLAPAPGSDNPMLGRGGIVLVLGLHHAPLAGIIIASGLAAIPRSLVEAAVIDGAGPGAIVRRILLPLIRPQIVGASLLLFVAGVGNFGIPALLGLPVGYTTLPTLVYRQLVNFGPAVIADAAAVSMLIALIAGAGVLAATMVFRDVPARLEADAAMTPFWRLGRWRVAVEAALWTLMAVAVLVPLASLLATALVPAFGVRLTLGTVTLAAFFEVLVSQQVTTRAFRNSLLLAGAAAAILAVLSILAAYALERPARRYRALALPLIEIPYALPGVVLAIAMILLFLKPLPLIGVSIYATPWIILFAYLARFLALALKPVLAAMAVVSREEEEAAAVFGASLWQRLRHVLLPRLLPAATAGALLAFLLAFNELTVSALLWSAGTETLGVALLSLEDAGLAPEAAAIGVTATVIVAAIMAGLDAAHRRLPAGVLPWRVLAGAP